MRQSTEPAGYAASQAFVIALTRQCYRADEGECDFLVRQSPWHAREAAGCVSGYEGGA